MPIRPGPWEIGLILVIILIVFGVGKLPQVGTAVGKSLRAFKKGQSGDDEEEAGTKTKKTTKKTTRKKAAKKRTEVKAEEKVEAKAEEKAEAKALESQKEV